MDFKATLKKISPKRMDPKVLVLMVAVIAVVAVAAVAVVSSLNSSANSYKVSFPAGQGYEVNYDGNPSDLKEGDTFTFAVTVNEKYDPLSLVVKANGVQIDPDEAGGFTFTVTIGDKNIDITIDVSAFTVTYIVNGGTGDVAAQKVLRGDMFVVAYPDGLTAPFGMEFKEWHTHAGGLVGTAYAPGDTIKMTGNIVLYAQWTPLAFQVTYDVNGGIGEVDPISVYYGSSFEAASADDLEFPGYLFDSWNTMIDGTGDSYAVGAKIKMKTLGMALYAQWTLDEEQWVAVTFYMIDDEEDVVIYSADFLKGYVLSSEWNQLNKSFVPLMNDDPIFMDVWYTTEDRDVEFDMFQVIGDEEFELYLVIESQVERYLADKYIPKPISDAVREAILNADQELGYESDIVAIFGYIEATYDEESGTVSIEVCGIAKIMIGDIPLIFEDLSKAIFTIPAV
jgi:hypothetical protein